jgi:hypothetical protein
MLRLYKPIPHDIFKLQEMLKHLVCSVWCEASDDQICEDKLSPDFKTLYLAYSWLKEVVDLIYEKFEGLSPLEKLKVKQAFLTTNSIEKLCDANLSPIYLNNLPSVIEKDVKPLLVEFYETLLERAKVPGTKKDYYEKLIKANEYKYCPCCGMTDIEQEDSKYREAFDHYLPKAHYPFASINFENLVPLCYKCNSDRKGEKDPLEGNRKSFYPFSSGKHNIDLKFAIDKTKDLSALERSDLKILFISDGNDEKLKTWDTLFEINDRYNDMTRSFIKAHLRKIKRRHKDFSEGKIGWSYINSLDKLITDYEFDKYEDKKFLKIPLMQELKNCHDLIEVYG